jgi:hypothetical protein
MGFFILQPSRLFGLVEFQADAEGPTSNASTRRGSFTDTILHIPSEWDPSKSIASRRSSTGEGEHPFGSETIPWYRLSARLPLDILASASSASNEEITKKETGAKAEAGSARTVGIHDPQTDALV